MMRIPIAIPIFYKTDDFREHEKLVEDLGIDTPRPDISDSEERDVFFYHIYAVTKYIENGKTYGCIMANDDEFISPWSADKINQTIINHISKTNKL